MGNVLGSVRGVSIAGRQFPYTGQSIFADPMRDLYLIRSGVVYHDIQTV